jgi:uncharacterized membrane protein YczE
MTPNLARRIAQLLIGLVLYGIAIALMLRGAIGVEPWTVFSQGVARHLPLSIGALTVVIGALVLLAWIPLKQRPGIGTVANVLILGPAIDLGLLMVPPVEPLLPRIAIFAGGLLLLAVASGLYIGARFGPGPRDGLMTGLVARTGRPIWMIRTGLEVSVLAIGWLLGGTVGLGTVAFAVLIGPLCNITIPLLRVPEPTGTAAAGAPDGLDGAGAPHDARLASPRPVTTTASAVPTDSEGSPS